MKKLGSIGSILALALASTSPVQAQSLRAIEGAGQSDTRAMVGITIPFGGDNRSAESQPRLDLKMEMSRIGSGTDIAPSINPLYPDRRDVRRATFSLTFEENPRFMLNGFSLDQGSRLYSGQQEEGDPDAENGEEKAKKERKTGQKVLRGAAVAGGVFVLVLGVGFAAFVIDCNDDGGCVD